ncbi:MAG: HlyC/CorC family transporter [Anaerovoracaceae bacterium]
MDSDSIAIVFAFAGLLILSAYFSSTETAFSSLNRFRMKSMADEGDVKAAKALKLAEDYDRILSTILIGNNIVNIMMASLATVFFVNIMGGKGVTAATVVTTLLVLLFGEITPKSMAKEAPERVAMAFGSVLSIFTIVFHPINLVFRQWKRLIERIFKLSGGEGISQRELLTFVDAAQQEGGIDEHEGELIRNVIQFNDLEVEDVLTPRVKIVAVDLESDTKEDVELFFRESGFSRLPVYRKSIDYIEGLINAKDFYMNVYKTEKSLEEIVKPMSYVPPAMKVVKLLKRLQASKTHMVAVADEYGGVTGIVTLEDVLEELVGDIWDEHDTIVEDFILDGKDTYRVLAHADLDDMLDIFNLDYDFDMSTVGGWAMEELGKIPEEGDKFIFDCLDVTVIRADDRKALELRIKKIAPAYDGQEKTQEMQQK